MNTETSILATAVIILGFLVFMALTKRLCKRTNSSASNKKPNPASHATTHKYQAISQNDPEGKMND